MSLDTRTPVIVGASQMTRHPDPGSDLSTLTEPVDMMAEVLRLAALDSGGARLLESASSLRVVSPLSWRYQNAVALLADRLGIRPREELLTTTGGNSPQMLVNDACRAIARGEHDIVLVAGAEAMYTRRIARGRGGGERLSWSEQSADIGEPRMIGTDKPGMHDLEAAASLLLPVHFYPLFENALRAAAGEGIDEHQSRVARLWSVFSEVASRNPHAWSRRALSPREIETPSQDNRMIAFPYPKLMTANIQTDQAAALVICSAEAARSAGVPSDRWVFPLSGAEANDHWYVSNRADLHSSPAIAATGRAALGLAAADIDDVAHIDLYSCFPSSVEISAAELGLPLDDRARPLTVTGGLGFAGGPGNNYVTHSIAAMVDVLRGDPGSLGLVTALGWFATKHSVGLYSTSPSAEGYRYSSPQEEVDALPSRAVVPNYEGTAVVETYTVTYERDGSASLGLVACLVGDGSRAWGQVRDPGLLGEMTTVEQCGRKARMSDGLVELL